MPDDFLDMTITSPPYDDLRDYNGYHFPVEEIAAGLVRENKTGRSRDLGRRRPHAKRRTRR